MSSIDFPNPPQWLSHDLWSFTKYTPIGTIWKGVDRNAINGDGQTEFIRAARKGGSQLNLLYAEMLAEFDDTDLNIQDKQGRTALHWAYAGSHHDLVRLCLSVP